MHVFIASGNKGLTHNQLDGVIPISSALIRAKHGIRKLCCSCVVVESVSFIPEIIENGNIISYQYGK